MSLGKRVGFAEVSHAITLGDLNIGTAPGTLILPLYMAFLL